LLIVETITNPLLRVSDLAALADMAHANGARLLVDNTFAGPIVCRPMELGADLVMESLTKSINGHSDVNLGLLCGRADCWERVPLVLSAWGLASGPFDCWLAARGLGTLALRAQRADANALAAAQHIRKQPQVESVHYPGLPEHADHALARRQFGGRFGSMVTFTLRGGTPAAEQFIRAAEQIPFCPSLGDLSTTLSHPESTSHRGMTAEARAALGIFGGTIRLSVGIESAEAIQAALSQGFAGVAQI
jgi:cystathionine beta-lyase/cystathionine gamma-synthase